MRLPRRALTRGMALCSASAIGALSVDAATTSYGWRVEAFENSKASSPAEKEGRLKIEGAAALVAGILSFRADTAWTAVIRVPEDAPSVLVAVDMAAEGDSVIVGPGTWSEREDRIVYSGGFPRPATSCAFPSHGMTILGAQGAEATVLEASPLEVDLDP